MESNRVCCVADFGNSGEALGGGVADFGNSGEALGGESQVPCSAVKKILATTNHIRLGTGK